MRNPSTQELNRLLEAVDPKSPFGGRDLNMLLLAAHTGLRISELVALNLSDVWHAGAPRQVLFVARGKGGRERCVPMNSVARQAVADLVAFNRRRGLPVTPDSPLLMVRTHSRISVRLVQAIVQQLRERSGVDTPITPHSLRHHFGTQIAEKTANLRVVQQLLGHARLAHVQTYVSASPESLARAVEAIV